MRRFSQLSLTPLTLTHVPPNSAVRSGGLLVRLLHVLLAPALSDACNLFCACSYLSDSFSDDVDNNTAGNFVGVQRVNNSVIKNNKAGTSMYFQNTDTSLTIESNQVDYSIGYYNSGACRRSAGLSCLRALCNHRCSVLINAAPRSELLVDQQQSQRPVRLR